jgi:hypothetical protein
MQKRCCKRCWMRGCWLGGLTEVDNLLMSASIHSARGKELRGKRSWAAVHTTRKTRPSDFEAETQEDRKSEAIVAIFIESQAQPGAARCGLPSAPLATLPHASRAIRQPGTSAQELRGAGLRPRPYHGHFTVPDRAIVRYEGLVIAAPASDQARYETLIWGCSGTTRARD